MAHVQPSIKVRAFSCPHCGAFADQHWHMLSSFAIEKGKLPELSTEDSKSRLEKLLAAKDPPLPPSVIDRMVEAESLRVAGFLVLSGPVGDARARIVSNLHISECFSCNKIALWRRDELIYPPAVTGEPPSMDLPDPIKADYDEAGSIVDKSPRGAAALLRLAVERLCKHLGGSGENINEDIATLVKKGLPIEVRDALDVVRILGNEAVHPGQIDLKDDRDTVAQLFTIINTIADRMITQPKQLKALRDMIPPEKLKQIDRRDQKALEARTTE